MTHADLDLEIPEYDDPELSAEGVYLAALEHLGLDDASAEALWRVGAPVDELRDAAALGELAELCLDYGVEIPERKKSVD